MGRLIDADELYGKYCELYEDTATDGEMDRIAYVISSIPTAYDVEKVVAKLEDVRGYHTSDDDYDCASWNAYTYAINTVRNGGKE